ncbi:12612_t:CDS:1 [Cetraspora pellucida]|uniref:12612_t:CDS:1 n=1 Tax=Cetraspora pellucida TaxID=1433469 RepID=A0A9N8ZNR7_9GLOM|nr:12612_t:CDS:1 [Cetraspora pellucida]
MTQNILPVNLCNECPSIYIFPDNAINEEPMEMEDTLLEYHVPTILDRRIERHRQRRAIYERAGRLPKTSLSALSSGSSSSSSSSSSNGSNNSNKNSTRSNDSSTVN